MKIEVGDEVLYDNESTSSAEEDSQHGSGSFAARAFRLAKLLLLPIYAVLLFWPAPQLSTGWRVLACLVLLVVFNLHAVRSVLVILGILVGIHLFLSESLRFRLVKWIWTVSQRWWVLALLPPIQALLVWVAFSHSSLLLAKSAAIAGSVVNLHAIIGFTRWLNNPFSSIVGWFDEYDRDTRESLKVKKGAVDIDRDKRAKEAVTKTELAKTFLRFIQGRVVLGAAFSSAFFILIVMTVFTFAVIYRCVAIVLPDSFTGLTASDTWGFVYLSIITIFTIGYGDVTPLSGLARLSVAGEAFAGMFLLILAVSSFSVVSVHRFENNVRYATDGLAKLDKYLQSKQREPSTHKSIGGTDTSHQ